MNKKLLFFYIFAFLFIALPVSAHTPRIIYGQAGDIEITNPDISQAFYDELKNAPRDYFFASNKDFNLYLNILVPESANYNGRYAANVFLTNKDEDLLLYSTDLSSTAWFEFYEPFGRDYYIKGPESEIPLSAGNYKIEVYSADNTGKYVLVVGKTESFTLFDTIAIYWQLPILKLNFFNTPVWQFLFTPFGMAGIAIIFGLIILITFLGYITTSIKEKIRIKANTTILLTSAGMQVKDEILKLLHKPAYDILVGFITTATKPKEDKSYMEKELEIMREEIRFNVELIDIEGKNQSQLMKMLERKDLIYVEGGNTFYLLKHIRKSGFDKVVKKLLKRGKVYVGV